MRICPAGLVFASMSLCVAYAATGQRVEVHMSWGEGASQAAEYYVKLIPGIGDLHIEHVEGLSLEPGEGNRDGAWRSRAGGGDVDGIEFTLASQERRAVTLQNLHVMWADLIDHSDAGTARRLREDAAIHPDSPRLTVSMNQEGTRGFTVTLDQLLEQRAIWIPSLHVYLATGDTPMTFDAYEREAAQFKGRRILDQVSRDPEATYAEYQERLEDMGSPAYRNPQQHEPGHIVCLAWDSSIPKFGIDRGAGVRNDLGNPDHFQFWFSFGDITQGIQHTWRGQRLWKGLPVITTAFEQEGIRYEVEQFAYPLEGVPAERRGDLKMVLMQQITVTELEGHARQIPISLVHRRQFPPSADATFYTDRHGDALLFREHAHHRVLLAVGGLKGEAQWSGVHDYQREMKRLDATFDITLSPHATAQFTVKLPSPMVPPEDVPALEALDYRTSRERTLRFWSEYVDRGARFQVPEEAVNDLFRASLWHALRLPRRHGGSGPNVAIDLPYSNFAYSQTGTPWPVNQSVYV
ncbi:MAG: hypothetical protein ACRD9L_16820, partial [Bryobacteraceae bacterium]